MNPLTRAIALLLLCLSHMNLSAQDAPVLPGADKLTDSYLTATANKASHLNHDIAQQTDHYLSRLQREEARLYKKLAKKDSAAAAKALASSQQQYQALRKKLDAPQQLVTKSKRYIPLLDTVATSLKFFRQYGDLVKKGIGASGELKNTLTEVDGLQGKLQQADDVQAFIKDRRQQLSDQLQQAGMGDALKSFNKDAYYYSAQISEYRAALNDPDKAERKAIALLNQLPAFQQFMKQNSLLASLFGTPGGNAAAGTQALAGLQTRAQVQQLMQSQIAAGGPNAQAMVQQNIQSAQAQLNNIKERITKLGGNSDVDMPGFKPNTQKTKTFLQRIEYGANIQSQKAGSFFPTTTTLALTAGYKLNDKSAIGIGASYLMGWGTGIQHIALSNQGIGFRTYADLKLKGSFWLSGGGEMNYRSAFRDFSILNDYSPWQKSALLGITKKYKAGGKLKGNVQLLYDFLWRQQVPAGQPVKFRIGYGF